jgi:TonB family protein
MHLASPIVVAQSIITEASVTDAPAPATPIRRDAKPLSGQDGIYPRTAIRRGIFRGSVTARARIDSGGNVIEVFIVYEDPPGYFDKAATDALRTWKFAPESEPYTAEFDFVFKMNSDQSNDSIQRGNVQREIGRYSYAESLLRSALGDTVRAWGKDHPEVGHALNALAALYTDEGRFAEAEQTYQYALNDF